ncbi:hypothetical protein M011DRAFT_399643 [Sporormia fimetaria CBS 119925]|uniref:protein-ribulosamine 3-kinase n=1 Tax=Sporormia fimetaria CBS 119925 TaxID=1340428 RepID=A0A6A6VGK0_9PLEO|nr:hypothetical protein M011DRAFT_399643 [Sporormia fimetaria CBS 119925]
MTATPNPSDLRNTPEQPEAVPSVKKVVASLGGVFPFDDAVIDALPKGSTFRSVEHFGKSAYTITGRVVASDPDGSEKSYFLKVAYGEPGRIMLRGQWESFKDIYKVAPGFIPIPFGFGQYKVATLPTYFFLSEFVDMDETAAPGPEDFCAKLAAMHRDSKSPTGKFGYHVQTCDGKLPHIVDWEASWADFFRKLFLGVLGFDLETNGPWPELERAAAHIADKVIPRLLGVLQADGRHIDPAIIHGDLWEGNVGINRATGESILFDAGSFFAHNEMELGHWRCDFTSVFCAETYTRHYLLHYPAAEPVDEFDDRLRLYSIKGNLIYSAGHPGSSLRRTAYNNMCYLCEKYAPTESIAKYDQRIDPFITGRRIVPHLPEASLEGN